MWFQAGAMFLFGVGEYASRFPNAIAGVITLVLLYSFGSKLYDKRFGLLWVAAYFGSVLPHLYFRSGIIDPWFNLLIFLGLYHIILFYWKKENTPDFHLKRNKWIYLIAAGVFTGLAILVKGPVAYLITGLVLVVYWISQRFRFYINAWEIMLYTLIVMATAGLWFGLTSMVYGPAFIYEFTIRQWELFANQDAGHGGFIGYHVVVLLIGVFPASIFMLRSFGRIPVHLGFRQDFKRWMSILFWVVLVLFSIVSTKIVHYSSLAYFPMTYLAALVIYQIWKGNIFFAKWMKYSILTIAFIFGIALIALPWVGMNVDIIKPLFSADPFAEANLQAEVPWTGFESIVGVWFILIALIGTWYFTHKQIKKGVLWLFGGTGVFVFIALAFIISNIEMITQNAAIEFYISKQDCNCYVTPERYKSYAHLFYTKIKPGGHPQRHDMNWLKTGDIDRDVYFVAKVTGTADLKTHEDIEFLYEKNGFTFWLRKRK